jgi:hypothetical protein
MSSHPAPLAAQDQGAEKTLDTPLPVAAGQTIDFTVQISFS